jgi:hypothetical protein
MWPDLGEKWDLPQASALLGEYINGTAYVRLGDRQVASARLSVRAAAISPPRRSAANMK